MKKIPSVPSPLKLTLNTTYQLPTFVPPVVIHGISGYPNSICFSMTTSKRKWLPEIGCRISRSPENVSGPGICTGSVLIWMLLTRITLFGLWSGKQKKIKLALVLFSMSPGRILYTKYLGGLIGVYAADILNPLMLRFGIFSACRFLNLVNLSIA